MNTANQKHLIVISVDALNKLDFDFIRTLNHFNTFLEEGAYVREVKSVYPTLTYTCHSSIITGTYPDKHGIHANEKPTPERASKQPWYWYVKDIKVPTLYDYVKQAGMTSGNVLWPCMTDAPIDYNIPEIWSVTGRSYPRELLSHTKKNMLLTLAKHAGKADGTKQPMLDDFTEACSIEIITKKKPNLMTLHLLELDQERHNLGLNDPKMHIVLTRINERIGRIIDATKKAGTYENTNFVVLGDHGGTNHDHIIYLNKYFLDQGLIQVDGKNNITKWKAYANGCGGSVQIMLDASLSGEEKQKVVDQIGKIPCQPNSFVKTVYTKEEALKKFSLKGPFDFVFEAKDGYIFRTELADKVIKHRASVNGSYLLEHGHNPNHPELKTLFMAMGPDIKKGVVIPESCIIDNGPTMAKLLGITMEQVDGIVLESIFK